MYSNYSGLKVRNSIMKLLAQYPRKVSVKTLRVLMNDFEVREVLFRSKKIKTDICPYCRVVTSSKRRHKNSMKCAIAKFLNQDGRPDRYWKSKKMMGNSAKDPHPTRERTHRHRSIPEIAVLCHLPRKTSQLPAEPEEWPKR